MVWSPTYQQYYSAHAEPQRPGADGLTMFADPVHSHVLRYPVHSPGRRSVRARSPGRRSLAPFATNRRESPVRGESPRIARSSPREPRSSAACFMCTRLDSREPGGTAGSGRRSLGARSPRSRRIAENRPFAAKRRESPVATIRRESSSLSLPFFLFPCNTTGTQKLLY